MKLTAYGLRPRYANSSGRFYLGCKHLMAGIGLHLRGKRQDGKEIQSFIGQENKTIQIYISFGNAITVFSFELVFW
ncbi:MULTISPECIES: hypothetical protein [unclassified Moorena]|nr:MULTISPECIES: hypothetical protein [unclassified Moorena]NER88090.1 hypothetical protein [Moorena sp. SIO3A2]NET67505.1 hypothetical protein [Moorena sp. SIO1G6]OLT66555.1 hypothetical protein BI334_17425 [Moorena producens 3L]